MSWNSNILTMAGRIIVECVRFAANGTPDYAQGNVYWDDDDKTLALQTDSSEVTLQIGQEVQVRVVNVSGAQINNGQPVYISGQSGSRAKIDLATAAADNDASHMVGVVTHDIDNNETGYVTAFGLVRGLDTSSYTAGNVLYLQDAAGTLGTSAGTVNRESGIVIISHATNGVILVNIHHA